jgi:O-methyltransferase
LALNGVILAADANRMLDIGGGHGTYSVAFCRRNPQLQATILHLPQAVQAAAPILAEEQLGSRVVHRIGSALTEDFGKHEWDIILISHLVHHFDEEPMTTFCAARRMHSAPKESWLSSMFRAKLRPTQAVRPERF